MDLPPIINDIEEDLKKYIQSPDQLPIHQYEKNQEFWPRTINYKELLHFEGSPLCTTLKVQRDPSTGEITQFKEVSINDAGSTAKNSMSFNRAPAPPTEATRGNASFIPFWPACFANEEQDEKAEDEIIEDKELLIIPPGFDRGLAFENDTVIEVNQNELATRNIEKSENIINLLDLVQQEQDLLGVWDNIEEEQTELISHHQTTEMLPEEEEILPKEAPILNISVAPPQSQLKGTEWAILLDCSKPVTNFKEKIPQMAIEYDFELDTFQKLAILQLEQHNHVFVAAHTSAGKTVVAEYAIALSQRHMTRSIYTSPIKALSNQKYRDFKHKFKDVGLITGDFQINATASCLIMTTEILRSMLYCGSEITRDLEYVIFDEVHYINDRERGHVWEQVLILLPAHVCVVLLSATVPNTIEFADWLGRTHQRKVYVVTTYKRPVPLQHFLYTGKCGKTVNNRFMILNADIWNIGGYIKAKETIKVTDRTFYNLHPKEEKQLWLYLIDHLKKNDLLPVVAFTFSRQKCDNNAMSLKNVDLITKTEKFQVRMFFNKCIQCIKAPDREIPQIVNMRDILERGIGVHHSGILPIIKEIVEMLFQMGLIKLLFATETFAMGVNMPARTVIFDSIKKHDGKNLRELEPAEYIQMAGRAGRRGLDKQGTVIILCKTQVPPDDVLKKMMLGKPSLLVSQFRLTYGMVLNLLRKEIKSLSVEGVMSRSFREAGHQKNMVTIKQDLIDTNIKLEELSRQQIGNYLQPLVNFYDSATLYLQKRKTLMPTLMFHPKMQKVMNPGRILLINLKNHENKLALLLSVIKSKTLTYKVLILTDSNQICDTSDKEISWYQMLGLADEKIYSPIGTPGHDIIVITPCDIFEISGKTFKLDNIDLIIKDWEKRQMERFKNDPPGQTCCKAVQELQKITLASQVNSKFVNNFDFLHFINDINVNDSEVYHDIKEMYVLKDKLIGHLQSTQIPNFDKHFETVFARKFLEEKKKHLEYELSNASLTLYPDYEKRINLLRTLNYVDNQNRVQLKGQVACQMGMNELLITELVLRNILTKLEPAEVAALLSALVYRVKRRNEGYEYDDSELTKPLLSGIKQVSSIFNEIGNLENSLEIHTEEFQEDLNFGLVLVVYEWANQKSFSDIMNLTEIQEGIIVRCIQQLNETICDVRDAARIIGDPELQSKMEETSTAIKRDIVFAASLYINDEKDKNK